MSLFCPFKLSLSKTTSSNFALNPRTDPGAFSALGHLLKI